MSPAAAPARIHHRPIVGDTLGPLAAEGRRFWAFDALADFVFAAARDEEVADVRVREDVLDRVLRAAPEDRRFFAEAPCFVFLGVITSESCVQASVGRR